MNDMFTDRVRRVMENAAMEAQKLGSDFIDGEHIVLGMLTEGNGVAVTLFTQIQLDLEELRSSLEESILNRATTIVMGNVPFTDTVRKIINRAQVEAETMNYKYVGTEHLLLAMLALKDTPIYRILLSFGLNYEAVKKQLSIIHRNGETRSDPKAAGTKTPFLDKFGLDLVEAGRQGKLDPIIGREKEIDRVMLILSRRKKNNPLLIGEPGVGKTAIVEGVAQKIANGEVAHNIKNKRLITLDLGMVVAGTKFRGQFEERIKNIINEIRATGNVIIFLDEIHTIIGAGGAEGTLDAANLLKPMLARGEVQCIGATTAEEFKKYIEKDGALERRFQPVQIDPPDVIDTIRILQGVVKNYETFHQVKYTVDSLKYAAQLSDRYINDRYLPDKALDILDEAGAYLHLTTYKMPPEIKKMEEELNSLQDDKQQAVNQQNYEKAAQLRDKEKRLKHELDVSRQEWNRYYQKDQSVVTSEVISEIVSQVTGVPLRQLDSDESQRLLNLEKELKKSIAGQTEAIYRLSSALRRSHSGLRDPRRPIGSFIFLGPSGVGKTHTAITLAKILFGSENAIIRLDMTEFMEKFNVSRLIGAPPGYIGFQEGGQLTERVRRKPYSIILFDEFEKAHPDLQNILLQILDTGTLTDSNGRKINFRNTVIILTTNIGSSEIKNASRLGFNKTDNWSNKEIENFLIKELKKDFKPELVNRFDDIITFHHLSSENLNQITELLFQDVSQRAHERSITLSLSCEAREFIAQQQFDQKIGARLIRHSIQNMIEDLLSEKLLSGEIKAGDHININLIKDKITLHKD